MIDKIFNRYTFICSTAAVVLYMVARKHQPPYDLILLGIVLVIAGLLTLYDDITQRGIRAGAWALATLVFCLVSYSIGRWHQDLGTYLFMAFALLATVFMLKLGAVSKAPSHE